MSKIKISTTHTHRRYLIAFISGDEVIERNHSLDEIMSDSGNEFEYNYAIQEEMDKVLDLRKGEALHMKFDRDSEDSQGVIKRIV